MNDYNEKKEIYQKNREELQEYFQNTEFAGLNIDTVTDFLLIKLSILEQEIKNLKINQNVLK